MTEEPTFKLAVELTATQIEALATLVSTGAEGLKAKIISEPGHTISDIAGANREIRSAEEAVEILNKALLADCREIMAMFGLGYQDAQEARQ